MCSFRDWSCRSNVGSPDERTRYGRHRSGCGLTSIVERCMNIVSATVSTPEYSKTMEARIRKWGNSLALRIPQSLATQVGLKLDATVEMIPRGEELDIALVKLPDSELDILLAGVTESNLHAEVANVPILGKSDRSRSARLRPRVELLGQRRRPRDIRTGPANRSAVRPRPDCLRCSHRVRAAAAHYSHPRSRNAARSTPGGANQPPAPYLAPSLTAVSLLP